MYWHLPDFLVFRAACPHASRVFTFSPCFIIGEKNGADGCQNWMAAPDQKTVSLKYGSGRDKKKRESESNLLPNAPPLAPPFFNSVWFRHFTYTFFMHSSCEDYYHNHGHFLVLSLIKSGLSGKGGKSLFLSGFKIQSASRENIYGYNFRKNLASLVSHNHEEKFRVWPYKRHL